MVALIVMAVGARRRSEECERKLEGLRREGGGTGGDKGMCTDCGKYNVE